MKYRTVKQFPKYEVSASGSVRNRNTGRILRGWKQDGYQVITLTYSKGQRTLGIHQVVAFAWIGKRPPAHEVNHIDEDKQNNHWGNLEYVTPRQNTHHTQGRRGYRMLTDKEMEQACKAVLAGATLKSQGELFGVKPDKISDCLKGKAWKDLAHLKNKSIQPGKGERNTQRLFTPEQVRKIRKCAAAGVSQREQARCCGVSKRTIQMIVSGITYTEV